MEFFFQGEDPFQDLCDRVNELLKPLLKEIVPEQEFPSVEPSLHLKKGDLSLLVVHVARKMKVRHVTLAKEVSEKLSEKLEKLHLDESTKAKYELLQSFKSEGPFIHMTVKRDIVMYNIIKSIHLKKEQFGRSTIMKGKKAIVEHTSANPIAPLHIGNLRNVIIGSHLSKLLGAVGYDVEQHYFVNDLGAQIGLTALGYSKIDIETLAKNRKIDQVIGMIYAIMNTLSEIQKINLNIFEEYNKIAEKKEKEEKEEKEKEEKKVESGNEWINILADLNNRETNLVKALVLKFKDVDILQESAKLCLAYEQNKLWAVKLFRNMANTCLLGIQETLDTFDVRHNNWDYESELGWDGSNDRLLKFIKNSPYFVPPTQSNKDNKPEGGYLNLNKFILDFGYKIGKGGFQKDYPNLYILRPNGSTLYTFRDVAYSLKKTAKADLVLNVIGAPQILPQEKVALALNLIDPKAPRKQFHMSYEIVRLTTGKMSGRRGKYLLADDLYIEIKSVILKMMKQRMIEKNQQDMFTEEELQNIVHQVGSAAIKYSLLSTTCRNIINFDIKKVTSFQDTSAPFLLYNSTRVKSIFRKYKTRVEEKKLPDLVPFDETDFSVLTDDSEWELVMNYLMKFNRIIRDAAIPKIPVMPKIPEFGTSKIPEFLNFLVRRFSSYYKRVPILNGKPEDLHPRLRFVKAVSQVVDNGLRLLSIEPLERM
ncbi:arginine--tRNA ligase [Anaeramoeba flamelloides]|uniref:arginine--tRNA ligase n=1 Tax=Anaeramoeba flamelloides TaxID=1746091 RepID=A0ABQ8X2N7_9EUKA|nr:arginine--tRNA ligase [Anaeramoeba flamelloides]